MILCPNCHHHEIIGALFCGECGAQLVSTGRLAGSMVDETLLEMSLSPRSDYSDKLSQEPDNQLPTPSGFSLRLLDSGKIIQLTNRRELTIGRAVEGQPILPDVDLSLYEAYAQGVSRLHAAIKIGSSGLSIHDLGSSNGTRVNGQKISAHVDFPLADGDIIALGRFKLQMIVAK
jgi:pSer/pThr/pTyr-binding forkhead associated (FHA) protein